MSYNFVPNFLKKYIIKFCRDLFSVGIFCAFSRVALNKSFRSTFAGIVAKAILFSSVLLFCNYSYASDPLADKIEENLLNTTTQKIDSIKKTIDSIPVATASPVAPVNQEKVNNQAEQVVKNLPKALQGIRSGQKVEPNFFNKDSEIYKKIIGNSLFFKDENLRKLETILTARTNGDILEPEDLVEERDKEESVDEQGNPISAKKNNARFYLNSIAYNAPNNWSIWVNGVKIASNNKKANPEIEVIAVTKSFARLKWITSYSRYVQMLTDIKNTGKLPKSVYVHIDNANNIAKTSFLLKPNQRLELTDVLRVKEGKSNF